MFINVMASKSIQHRKEVTIISISQDRHIYLHVSTVRRWLFPQHHTHSSRTVHRHPSLAVYYNPFDEPLNWKRNEMARGELLALTYVVRKTNVVTVTIADWKKAQKSDITGKLTQRGRCRSAIFSPHVPGNVTTNAIVITGIQCIPTRYRSSMEFRDRHQTRYRMVSTVATGTFASCTRRTVRTSKLLFCARYKPQ